MSISFSSDNILKIGVSLSAVAVGYYLWKYHQQQQCCWLDSLLQLLYVTKDNTKKSIERKIEDLGDKIEDYIELLKDKYISQETQEVLEDIKQLIGIVFLLIN